MFIAISCELLAISTGVVFEFHYCILKLQIDHYPIV